MFHVVVVAGRRAKLNILDYTIAYVHVLWPAPVGVLIVSDKRISTRAERHRDSGPELAFVKSVWPVLFRWLATLIVGQALKLFAYPPNGICADSSCVFVQVKSSNSF